MWKCYVSIFKCKVLKRGTVKTKLWRVAIKSCSALLNILQLRVYKRGFPLVWRAVWRSYINDVVLDKSMDVNYVLFFSNGYISDIMKTDLVPLRGGCGYSFYWISSYHFEERGADILKIFHSASWQKAEAEEIRSSGWIIGHPVMWSSIALFTRKKNCAQKCQSLSLIVWWWWKW